jgi:hypothetical protein
MSFSNYLENALLAHAFSGTTYTPAGTLYLSAHTANPDEDASGAEVSTSGTAYARQTVTFSTTGNVSSTSADVEFATATANYGTVTHVGVWDASTGGNMLAYATLTSSKVIQTGDAFRVSSGDFTISLD